jgi:hypothetical protein
MSLIDLCGISNLKWGLNLRASPSPFVESEVEHPHPQNNISQPETKSQGALVTGLELFLNRQMHTDGLEHHRKIENLKSLSSSSKPAPPPH